MTGGDAAGEAVDVAAIRAEWAEADADVQGNGFARVGRLFWWAVHHGPALLAALDRVTAERDAARAEERRVYGIAKMRESEKDRRGAALAYIAEAGCDVVRRGGPRCVTAYDEDTPDAIREVAPCYPCIARHALRAP